MVDKVIVVLTAGWMTYKVIVVLTIGAVLCSALTIFFHYEQRRGLVYFFKPLAMISIIAIAFGKSFPALTYYQGAIIFGLLFSLIGDIFLVRHEHFIQGLVSFFIAHLFYIAAFVLFTPSRSWLAVSALPVVACLAVMLWVLWPRLGKLKVPVMLYTIIIALMGWQALNRLIEAGDIKSVFAAAGALLFMASDSILAINKFRYSFHHAQLLLLITYFLAQWLIALSV
jgi:uncharacterized membrane protein YhhN